jgi:hypothetical protein
MVGPASAMTRDDGLASALEYRSPDEIEAAAAGFA